MTAVLYISSALKLIGTKQTHWLQTCEQVAITITLHQFKPYQHRNFRKRYHFLV
jgi:hypothetical protein